MAEARVAHPRVLSYQIALSRLVAASMPSEYGTHKPDSGLGFLGKIVETFEVFPSSLISGSAPDVEHRRVAEACVAHPRVLSCNTPHTPLSRQSQMVTGRLR